MKIISVNPQTIDKLTKYITPSSIEKARHQKFNAPKIKDTNLRCDKFFRTEELFDKKTDVVTPQNKYSIDDIPVYDSTSTDAIDKRFLGGTNNSYISSEVPFYVDIIGEKERVYIENYRNKNTRYPFENNINSIYKGFSIDEVVNIKHFAHMVSPNNSYVVEEEAFKLLKEGFPLSTVVKLIQESALHMSNGKTKEAKGLMTFLAEFPDLRRYMITYTNSRSEAFDASGAKIFRELLDMCNGNKKLANKILWECRIEKEDGHFVTDNFLFNIAKYLYKSDDKWTQNKEAVIRDIIKRKPHSFKYALNKIVRGKSNLWENFHEINNRL